MALPRVNTFSLPLTRLSTNGTRHIASTQHSLTFSRSHHVVISGGADKLGGWLEFNVPFQHKYGYIGDEGKLVTTVRVMLP